MKSFKNTKKKFKKKSKKKLVGRGEKELKKFLNEVEYLLKEYIKIFLKSVQENPKKNIGNTFDLEHDQLSLSFTPEEVSTDNTYQYRVKVILHEYNKEFYHTLSIHNSRISETNSLVKKLKTELENY